MTLHRTIGVVQKAAIGTAIGFSTIILLAIIFNIGVFIKNTLTPPTVEPPNHAFGVLPTMQFPKNTSPNNFNYSLNTISGGLPDFPDRAVVFPIQVPEPNLLNLQRVKGMVANIGIHSLEQYLGGANYEWDEPDGFQRRIAFNIVSFNFTMTSNYLSNPSVVNAQFLSDENSALSISQTFLNNLQLFPNDIDLSKTQNPDPSLHYVTPPQLFTISNGNLIPATSLSKAQLIRVDFYQNNITYELTTAEPGNPHAIHTSDFSIPILYSHPPYSTMTLWVASGDSGSNVVSANFLHQNIASSSALATYPLKTAQQAFSDLKDGHDFIAEYSGTGNTVSINNIYLGYYMTDELQPYLMPIYVFEGNDDFIAYVSAVQDQWIQQSAAPTPAQVLLK